MNNIIHGPVILISCATLTCCHEKFGPGAKMVLGLFFCIKNDPRTKLALQNLVHLVIDWSAHHFMD